MKGKYAMAVLEHEVKLWKEDQRLCEIADTLLKALVEKQLNVNDSLRVVAKMKRTVKQSFLSARWDLPLICEESPNEAGISEINRDHIKAEVNRRKHESHH